jgi:hypothetical protein
MIADYQNNIRPQPLTRVQNAKWLLPPKITTHTRFVVFTDWKCLVHFGKVLVSPDHCSRRSHEVALLPIPIHYHRHCHCHCHCHCHSHCPAIIAIIAMIVMMPGEHLAGLQP